MFDIAIIGAGLGGLECGLMLAKHGKRVCVLEKEALLGGCLQTFRRGGKSFDTGFHYVGGLDNGQMLNKLFRYLGLLDLPWHKLDNDCFDQVVIRGKSYAFAQGYDHFAQQLTAAFPHQAEAIASYVDLLRRVGDNINQSFEPRDTDQFYTQSLFATSAYDYLCQTFSDPLLRDVVSGTAVKMELCPEKLPLYTFAQINSSFIQSAYRLRGGGMQIAELLRRQIEELGGTVRRSAKVTGAVEADGKIKALVINNNPTDTVEAEVFISDAHPATTMNILAESKLLRNIYRKRINALENTYGMFTANIALKPNTIRYRNRNIYVYPEGDVWHIDFSTCKKPKAILISFPPPEGGDEYAESIDILTPMKWESVREWNGTIVGKRSVAYEELKKQLAEECIQLADKHIDGLANAVENIYTSTPLTYADYTATIEGSAYGIRKDYNQLLYTVLTPRTPVPNLLLTGQSLNLHGILGVSMTAVFTCAEILGMTSLVNDINR